MTTGSLATPYNGRPIHDIVHDFAVIRGDLSEAYAREQLERAVLACAEVQQALADARAEARHEAQRELVAGLSAFADQENAKPDPVDGSHTSPTWWNGHNLGLHDAARYAARLVEDPTGAAKRPYGSTNLPA